MPTACQRRGARGRRGHAHAVVDAQGAPPAVRPPDAPPRARHARRAARSSASSSSSATAPSTSPRPSRSSSSTDVPIEFVEQRVQRGTGDAASVALTAFADDLDARGRRHRRAAATPRCSAPRRSPCSPPSTASPTPPRRCSPPGSTTRPATGASCATTRATVDRIVEQADADRRRARDRRGQPVDLLLPPRAPRAGAAPPEPRERPGRVLPHRRRRGAAPGRATSWSRSRPTTPTEALRRQRPRAARRRRGRAARADQRRGGCARASTMIDPSRTYVDTTVELEPDVRLLPGTILSRAHGDRRRLGDRPRHPARRHDRRRGRGDPPDASPARRRSATGVTVGPFVSLRPGTPAGDGRARRHVRRDQEHRDRRGRQGAAPRLRRRRRHRRGRQHRRRQRSPPTTTAGASTAPRSARALRTGSNTVLVAPVEVGDGAYTGAGAVVNRDVPPGALAKGVPAHDRRGLGREARG